MGKTINLHCVEPTLERTSGRARSDLSGKACTSNCMVLWTPQEVHSPLWALGLCRENG
jgi:hypothetical protein